MKSRQRFVSQNGALKYLVVASRYRRKRKDSADDEHTSWWTSITKCLSSHLGVQIFSALVALVVCMYRGLMAYKSGQPALLVALEGVLACAVIFRIFNVLYNQNSSCSSSAPVVNRKKIRINIIGPASRATSAVVLDTDTIGDVIKRALPVALQRIEPIVYFPPHRGGPLKHSDLLLSIGVSEGSTLHMRWRLLGGATNEGSEEGDDMQRPSPHLRFNRSTGKASMRNPQYFQLLDNGDYQCLVCTLKRPMSSRHVRDHERTSTHEQAVRRAEKQAARSIHKPPVSGVDLASSPHLQTPGAGPSNFMPLPPEAVRNPIARMLADISRSPHDSHESVWVDPASGTVEIDWEADAMDTRLQPSISVHAMREMAEKTRRYLMEPYGMEENSDSAPEERSDAASQSTLDSFQQREAAPAFSSRSKRTVSENAEDPFFPWPDRETMVLDILRHIPRCAFSRTQNETIHWAMVALGVRDLPSDRVMDDIDRALQELCGIETLRYKGALGHLYYANDMAAIVAQEMANPTIRKHLHFYPEDAGNNLSEAWQADRWKNELDSQLLTPMVRIHGQDFYTDEICLLHSGACMPRRWFMRDSKLFAKAWSVDCIGEGVGNSSGGSSPWVNATENQWRLRSKGHRVVAFPMWLYCDDTSGNQSKKWNKHNSFLFTAAGLPRWLVHRESNIHFLATSNIAPPLEMLDGIVDQLEICQQSGIWAWDCEHNEQVLVIPSILALLGDNPMQSEFACHIGLRGRKFCRMCHVEGDFEGADEDSPIAQPQEAENDSDASSLASDTSGTASPSKTAKRSNKKSETMAQMVERVNNFMKISPLRNKTETQEVLRSQFTQACRVGGNAEYKRTKTRTGVKDTFQDFFLDKLFHISTKRGVSKADKEKLMAAVRKTFPSKITSPVWRIKDLDPHTDTPVEILHVILLGFVKYFWRDAIHRINTEQRATLIARLSSLDTAGLGISPLSGSTLVTYAGSLTGRDFRAIAQVAPFVLYDLLDKDLLACWNALGVLVPLVWQPKIENLDAHIKQLEDAIDLFLDCACQTTPRWFNKPKFHIILHLPSHIRRFGPAMLFATEGFESFNAIIRSASVHSNRHAPSRDIAYRMAKGNRIRHLISGGRFVKARLGGEKRRSHRKVALGTSPWMQRGETANTAWFSASPAGLELLNINKFGRHIFKVLGQNNSLPATTVGSCTSRGELMLWTSTEVAKAGFSGFVPDPKCSVYAPKETAVSNGDICKPGSWIIWSTNPQGSLCVGRVVESIQVSGSFEERTGKSSFIVAAPAIFSEKDDHYWMPRLQSLPVMDWIALNPAKSRVIYQEREATENLTMGVWHSNPDDLILNTAQMRDAIYLSPFRPPIPSYNRDIIIANAAKLEVDNRKMKQKKKEESNATASQDKPSKKAKSTKRVSSLLRGAAQMFAESSTSASLR
ncbi:hypothetical protein H0H81_003845 [Sphagnurus paluster]|uniref:Ubiquitin-like domain-containing protein n=1 Tax=Sphagnurus paluster TaxID=117069 RepID=A0A9P7GQH2_9AGAR|nr:hypothetical protein H0H81_003845 [Sphagnurus paluster]